MAAVTIRNLSEEGSRPESPRGAAQSQRGRGNARHSGGRRSSRGRLRLGTALSEMSRKIGLTNADVETLEHGRDARPAEPMRFE